MVTTWMLAQTLIMLKSSGETIEDAARGPFSERASSGCYSPRRRCGPAPTWAHSFVARPARAPHLNEPRLVGAALDASPNPVCARLWFCSTLTSSLLLCQPTHASWPCA